MRPAVAPYLTEIIVVLARPTLIRTDPALLRIRDKIEKLARGRAEFQFPSYFQRLGNVQPARVNELKGVLNFVAILRTESGAL